MMRFKQVDKVCRKDAINIKVSAYILKQLKTQTATYVETTALLMRKHPVSDRTVKAQILLHFKMRLVLQKLMMKDTHSNF